MISPGRSGGLLDPATAGRLVGEVERELALHRALLELLRGRSVGNSEVRACRRGPVDEGAGVERTGPGAADSIYATLAVRRAAASALPGLGPRASASRVLGALPRCEADRLVELRCELTSVVAAISAEGRARALEPPARRALSAA